MVAGANSSIATEDRVDLVLIALILVVGSVLLFYGWPLEYSEAMQNQMISGVRLEQTYYVNRPGSALAHIGNVQK